MDDMYKRHGQEWKELKIPANFACIRQNFPSFMPVGIGFANLMRIEPYIASSMSRPVVNLLRTVWISLKKSFTGFFNDKVPKLSGSLSYYMVFSMGPLLLILIAICGLFFGPDAVRGKIYGQLEEFVGSNTALQLQEIIKHAALSGKNVAATVIGAVTLLIGATSVFAEMQDSINMIWGVKPKPKKGWLKMLRNRFLSFSVIVSLGFLLLVSLSFSALVEALSAHLKHLFPQVTIVFIYILNAIITTIVTCLVFAVIFKVLPDAKIGWKDIVAGAIMTTILFLIGKFAISFYVSKSNVGTTFGPAGSLVVILLWIYYSAVILYFGAEFTKAYALETGAKIFPTEYAVAVEQKEIESENSTVVPSDKPQVETKSE